MKQITAKTLRDAKWRQIYEYVGNTIRFSIFACDELPGLTITHSREMPKYILSIKAKVKTIYTIKGYRTDSPVQAVKNWNSQVKRALQKSN